MPKEARADKEVKGDRTEMSFYYDTCPRKPGLHPNKVKVKLFL
jgi:hypothetical protein